MTAPLRVLLAGFGGLGTQDHQRRMYLPAFLAHPGFTVAAVAGDGPDDERTAAGLGVPYHDGLDAALAAGDAEVVSVCRPLGARAGAVEAALRAGRHVLADKPLAATAAECDAIEAAARKSGTVCLPAHHHRFGQAVRSAAAALAGGRVGLPWNIQADFLAAGGDPCPDGELANFGVYPVDVLQALTGLPVRRVHARLHGPAGAERSAVLLMDHDHGLTSTVTVGRTPAAADGPMAVHTYRVSGTSGVLTVDAAKPAATVRTAGARRGVWHGPDTVALLLTELYQAITTGRPAEIGPADAGAALRVIEAARRSAAAGAPVETDGETG
ncbi:MAG TPA: Gfo/Idh/MocA family oxidoreductase [Streptosporangiaceae bacterium]|jgi:predicted dehydrogenase